MKKIIALLGLTFAAPILHAVPNTIDMPVDMSLSGEKWCVSISSQCSTGWSFWQHQSGYHKAGGGIGGANDKYAWDVNLNSPSTDYDNGKPVRAVEDGEIYTGNGWGGSTYGQLLINHTTGADKWSTGYLHMSSIQKKSGTVKKGEIIGYISNVSPDKIVNHLHFIVYNGHNAGTSSVNVGFSGKTALGSSVTVKDLWVKSNAPIIANTANGFDAQFKLVNSSSSAITYAKVALSIHDASKNYLKDMKVFNSVTVPAGGTWATGIVYTNVLANAGTYYAVAKVAKNGTDWVNLADQVFTVTAANNLTRLGVTCPTSRLNPAQTANCAATAYYSNGSNKSVTSTATTSWVTNNSSAATVSSQGAVTAKSSASDSNVSISATYKDGAATQQGSASLTITGLDGKLPADYGCTADQKNVASKAITGGSIVLMYSSKCGTNCSPDARKKIG